MVFLLLCFLMKGLPFVSILVTMKAFDVMGVLSVVPFSPHSSCEMSWIRFFVF